MSRCASSPTKKRFDEAYQIAGSCCGVADGPEEDFSRLGDLYQAMKRSSQAADAYGRALTLAKAGGQKDDLWTLDLLRASALEDANRWPEAKQALEEGARDRAGPAAAAQLPWLCQVGTR